MEKIKLAIKKPIPKIAIVVGVTTIAVVAMIIVLISLLGGNMSQKKYNQKMDKLVSLLNYDGLTDDEIEIIENSNYNLDFRLDYIQSVETLAKELKLVHHGELGKDWQKHNGYPYAEELSEYVKTCDIDRLLNATLKFSGYGYVFSSSSDYYPSSSECIYNAIYNTSPKLFIKPILEDGIESGYYIDNPEAFPGVTRQEPYSQNKNYTNTFTVKHYGDFAIQESKTWYYTEGKYEWIAGVFHDTPSGYFTEEKTDLYYKGKHVLSVNNKWEENDPDKLLIYESDKKIYCFYLTNGILSRIGGATK